MPPHHSPVVAQPGHDFCLATRYCRRCGASEQSVAVGQRALACEPGVTGISWTRATERMRDQMARGPDIVPWDGPKGDNFKPASPDFLGREASLPLYRMGDFAPKPDGPSAA
jgi:hypothetical protein